MNVKRGEIWQVDLGEGEGSKQGGVRPCYISDNDMANKFSPVFHVSPLTTRNKNKLPVHVSVGVECGIDKRSTILVEQDALIGKNQLIKRIGMCTNQTIKEVEKAIKIQKGIIKPFIDKKYIDKIQYKIQEVNNFIKECIKNNYDYTEEFMEQSLLVGELIAYCKEYNIDYSKYVAKNHFSNEGRKLRRVL